MIKVMVVDDEKIVRMGLQALENWESFGFSFCYEASNGLMALEILKKDPEVRIILADLQMPKMDGLQLLEKINKQGLPVEVIVLSAHDRYDLVRQAFRLGVSDYVIKTEMNRAEILKQLKNAAAKLNIHMTANFSRPVLLAKMFIEERLFDKALSLSVVSYHVGLSENHLSSIFAKQTGKTFTEYVTDLRIKEAKVLLRDTNMKVYEVADKIGFANVEYFSKIFKKHTGKSPNQYL